MPPASSLYHNLTGVHKEDKMHPTVDEFLGELRRRGKSANTIVSYRNDLRTFELFTLSRGIRHTIDAGNEEILSFDRQLQQQGRSAATRAKKRIVIKEFFAYLARLGHPTARSVAQLPGISVPTRVPQPSDPDLFSALIQSIRLAQPKGWRNWLILRLQHEAGLKVSEVLSLDIDSITQENHNLVIACQSSSDAKLRHVIIPDPYVGGSSLGLQLDYYIRYQRRILSSSETKALFLNQRGERLSRQGWWLILKELASAAGLPETAIMSSRAIRHLLASQMLARGASVKDIQRQLGYHQVTTAHKLATALQQGAANTKAAI